MRILALLLSIGAAMGAGSINAKAHGYCSGGFVWPLWGFGLGLGLGSALSYRAEYPSYDSYRYTTTTYSYTPPANPQPAAGIEQIEPSQPAQATDPIWVPSAPGTGRWVPDPTPYRYTPTPAPIARPQVSTAQPGSEIQKVSYTSSPGGVPLYSISREVVKPATGSASQ
jgi:hypothetical protein